MTSMMTTVKTTMKRMTKAVVLITVGIMKMVLTMKIIIHLEEKELFLEEEDVCLEKDVNIAIPKSIFCDLPVLELQTF